MITLLRDLRMPVVTTLHTILTAPSAEQRSTFDSIWDALDPQLARLRVLALTLSRELSALAKSEKEAGRSSNVSSVSDAWAELESMLALGPEPLVRACPFCRGSIMSVATRCRYCLAKSPAGHDDDKDEP